jgi:hypothetical protein
LGLLNVNVVGHDNPSPTPGEFTGALIGYNRGTVYNSYSTGSVSTNANFAGGLVGYSDSGTITYSYSEATVTYTGADYDTGYGGLVGNNYGDGLIDHCYATGLVSELNSEHTGIVAGGLVGDNESGTITNSYATGNVQGFFESVGGLAGETSYGEISNSYATGSVEGLYGSIGGLVGYVYTSNISYSFATGSVEGDDNLGGLLGQVGSSSTGSFINDCYATGDITENDYTEIGGDGYEIGGLIGYAIGYTRLDNSYSTGHITSGGEYADDVGGLIGNTNSPYITNSFWDIETSGRAESYEGTGKTTTEMKTLSTFNNTATDGLDVAWDISLITDFDELSPTIWFIDDSTDYPRLFMEYVEPTDPPEDPPEDPPIDPPIEENIDAETTTSNATFVTTSSAQLNGTLTTLGSHDTVLIYFQYRKTGGSWINTTKTSRTTIGSFSKNITNLDPNSTYEFRSVVEFGTSSVNFGSTKSFTTIKVTIPKVVITDIGLIDDVLDLDSMLYYFTSQSVKIKGKAYPNTTVEFDVDGEGHTTQSDSNGNYEITLELPRGTNYLEYFAFNNFGSKSYVRELTLIIGTENFPPSPDDGDEEEDITDPETEDLEEQEDEIQEEITESEEEIDTRGIKMIRFSDEDGNPLVGAQVTIDGKTYTTNSNGEILAEGITDQIYTVTIKYKNKEYTQEILVTQDAQTDVIIELDNINIDWIKILLYVGAGILVILIITFISQKRQKIEY